MLFAKRLRTATAFKVFLFFFEVSFLLSVLSNVAVEIFSFLMSFDFGQFEGPQKYSNRKSPCSVLKMRDRKVLRFVLLFNF